MRPATERWLHRQGGTAGPRWGTAAKAVLAARLLNPCRISSYRRGTPSPCLNIRRDDAMRRPYKTRPLMWA